MLYKQLLVPSLYCSICYLSMFFYGSFWIIYGEMDQWQ